MTQKQVRQIIVRVDAKGGDNLKKISRDLGGISREVSRTSSLVGSLRNSFRGLLGISFAGFGIREITRLSDEFQQARDRISVFTGSAESANVELSKLFDLANDTAAPIGTIVVAYNRLAIALDDVGIKGDALLDLTRALQQSFRLAGATVAETRGALIQLSQGLASGELRGQELRSVLEANALAGGILADKLGIGRGEILKYSEAVGGIPSSTVISAFAEAFDELEDKAANLTLTFEQSLLIVVNKLTQGFGELNDTYKLSTKFSTALSFAVVNLTAVLSVLAGVLITLKLPLLLSGLNSILGALALLKGVIATIGFGGFATALGGLALAAGLAAAKFVFFAGVFSLIILAFADFDAAKNIFSQGLVFIQDKLLATAQVARRVAQFFTISDSGKKAQEDEIARLEERRQVLKKQAEELRAEFTKTGIGASLKELADALASKEAGIGITNIRRLNTAFNEGKVNAEQYAKILQTIKIANLKKEFAETDLELEDYNKRLKELLNPTKKTAEQFAEINRQLKDGKITTEQYGIALRNLEFEQLEKQVEKGAISFQQFNKELSDLKLKELQFDLNNSVISFQQFEESTEALRRGQLSDAFKQGNIGLAEFNKQLLDISSKFEPGAAIYTGVDSYIKSAGTLSQNIAGAIERAFGTLEDTLFDFVKTGRFEFAKFTQAILDDLTKIILRAAIVQPLANGILGAFQGGGSQLSFATSPGTLTAAQGRVFDGGVTAFAKGGIVNSPTMFDYSGGRGLMGEAGPEAIVPLRRTASGDLGVQATSPIVNVNVINNAGVEVETRETTNTDGQRAIEVLIVGKVKEAISQGSFDRQFSTQYGLRRRGV
jgi:lambda family phage tail tape measure protein